ADRDERVDALRPQCRDDAGGSAAPIVAGERGALEAERIHEGEEIVPERRLLAGARRRAVEEARRPVAAQIRSEDAASRRRERRRDAVPGTRIVGKAVQQDDRLAS